MEIIKANWVDKVDLEELLQKKAKTEGFRTKKPVEILESYKVVFRPFKRIALNISGLRVDEMFQKNSLIDAELPPFLEDIDHMMLLWRPKYSKCNPSVEEGMNESDLNASAVQNVIDDMMETRWQAQNYDDEMKPKLRRLQADPLSAISFLLPRTPGGLRKEQVYIDERKGSHAYILATSLVTNCSPRDIITSADIGETVLVETIIAIYRALDESTRILALETPCTNSINDAIKAGKALTRLCELYVECREVVSNTTK